jgi:hypothetical protein
VPAHCRLDVQDWLSEFTHVPFEQVLGEAHCVFVVHEPPTVAVQTPPLQMKPPWHAVVVEQLAPRPPAVFVEGRSRK